jgi:hypothetical protein
MIEISLQAHTMIERPQNTNVAALAQKKKKPYHTPESFQTHLLLTYPLIRINPSYLPTTTPTSPTL